jgi:O-antigen/teichoic acid export membrane protein
MLLRQSATYLAGKLIPAVMTFGLIAVYTRLLTPADYGVFAFVNATVGLVFSFSAMWLCTAALRLYGEARDKAAVQWSIAAGFAGVCAIALIAALIAAFLMPAQDRPLLAIGFALFVLTAWFEINADILAARLKAAQCVAMGALRTALGGALGGVLAWLGFGVNGILIGTIIGIAVPAALMTADQWRGFRLSGTHGPTLRKLLLFGMPLSLSYAVGAMVYATDRYIVSGFGGVALLGLYAVGFDLADRLIKSITQPLGTAALPLLINRLDREGPEGARAQARQNLVLLAAIVTPACLGLIAITPELTQLMLGEAYRDMARQIIPVIALTALLSGLRGQYFDHAFHLGMRTDRHVAVVTIMALVNLGAGLLLVHLIGAQGAAYGTLIAYAAGLAASIMLGRSVFALPAMPSALARIGAAALAMAALVSLLTIKDPLASLFIKAGLGALIYGALIVILDIGGLRGHVLARLARASSAFSTG